MNHHRYQVPLLQNGSSHVTSNKDFEIQFNITHFIFLPVPRGGKCLPISTLAACKSKMSETPNFESNAFGRKRKFKGNKSWKKADDKKGQSDGTVQVKKVAEEDGPSQEKRSKQDAAAGDSEKRQSAPVSQVLRGINVLSFAEARAVEIQDTMEALKEATTVEGKRVFQKLPRHMRRRAASFNRRRLPRRMHQKAIKEVLYKRPFT